jgi:hypothetical protein
VVATLIGRQNPDIERRILDKGILGYFPLSSKSFADLQLVTSILVAERFRAGIPLRSSSQKAAGLMGSLG